MSYELPALPYAFEALEPHLSSKTLNFHYGKHHQTYVTNLNNLLKDSPDAALSLEEVIQKSAKEGNTPVFNNAAQIWNHTFYWHSMKPQGGGKPQGALAERIQEDFEGYESFREKFKQAAVSQFGSGWAWLVLKDEKLEMLKTGNADLPMIHGMKPLLTIDVWEHAYYLDFQNRRPDYVDVFLDHLVNWDFAQKNF